MRKINLIGQTFSFLTVLEDDGTRASNGGIKWKCQCVCGNITYVTTTNLIKNKIKSCGCKRTELNRLGHIKDLTGQRFGRLVAIEYVKTDDNSNALWRCKCDCGNEKIAPSITLVRGDCNSCGCLKNEQIKDITGQTFGKLTALYRVCSEGKSKWHCRCECGNECDVFLGNLTRLHTTSCGCQNKSIGENNIKKILEKNNIKYIYDSPYFKDLYTSKNRVGRYDFILLDDNNNPYRIIEFDGRQHYNGKFWYEPFETRKERDNIKNQYAFSHNIPIIRIPYTERDNITLDLLLGDKYLLKKEVHNV